MVKVGIDSLAVYTARYALPLETLAKVRGVAPDKFHIGLGQIMMSVAPPGEDIVTLAASAACTALADINKADIDMLLFATESGIDQSKAAGLYLHELLDLPDRCRVIELKQACYSGTAALQLALPYLRENPHKKVLVVSSDIARYGLNTTGESSQGCGAVAMVLAANPRIIAFEKETGVVAENVMDFWRPNYLHEALVDGKYSSKLYLTMLEKSWKQYQQLSSRQFSDHDYFCYHSPVPRLVEKAHQHLIKINGLTADENAEKQIENGLQYNKKMGNSYTAALYVGLAALLDLTPSDLSGKRIGFYSYGSGCVAEFFSGVVQAGYQQALKTDYHRKLLASRKIIGYEEYELFYKFPYVEDGSEQAIPHYQTGHFRLASLNKHKRFYESVAMNAALQAPSEDNIIAFKPAIRKEVALSAESTTIKVSTPGKLILSGEHAIVYGQPALAMAIDRYVTATVTKEPSPGQIFFDLADLAHHSHLTYNALQLLKNRIKEKYHRFIRGEYSIRHVLQKPFELAHFALSILTESYNLSFPTGVKISVQSDLPIGCGMGSSAATILSVMQAISNYLQLPMSREALYKLALEAENMQHGKSSGLDLRVALEGGCLYQAENRVEERPLVSFPMYLVNTGSPTSSTGQCVETVAHHFKSETLQKDFAAVTQIMDGAILNQSITSFNEAIRLNHRLLHRIGVVPDKVNQFISQMEVRGGAAKICGAGAVTGHQAGAVLVSIPEKQLVTDLCHEYGYHILPITGEVRGVHAA